MKIVVISDIHANYYALKEVTKYIKSITFDKLIFLGDYLTDCPFPNRTMKLLFDLKENYDSIFIKGNREDYIENIEDVRNIKQMTSLNGSILYTKKKIRKEYLNFLKDTIPYYELEVDKYKILFAHGSTTNNRELFTDFNTLNEYMQKQEYNLYVSGHSHKKRVYKNNDKIFLNPGSLGILETGNFDATFLIINIDKEINYEFKNLTYNVNKVLKDFKISSLKKHGKTYTKCIIDSFKTGCNEASKVISLGYEIACGDEVKEEDFKMAYNIIKEKKKYKNLFFDIDNTIFDFNKTEIIAFKKMLKHFNIKYTKDIFIKYQEINHQKWSDYSLGKITRHECVYTRYKDLFKSLNLDLDGVLAEDIYQENLSNEIVYIKDAKKILKKLSKHYNIYFLTNGVSNTQRKRLTNSNLIKYSKGLYISDEIGYQKPQKEFFQYVLNDIKNISKEECLMIGDSLTNDILGANNIGIDAVWFNFEHIKNDTSINSKYVINELKKLLDILN